MKSLERLLLSAALGISLASAADAQSKEYLFPAKDWANRNNNKSAFGFDAHFVYNPLWMEGYTSTESRTSPYTLKYDSKAKEITFFKGRKKVHEETLDVPDTAALKVINGKYLAITSKPRHDSESPGEYLAFFNGKICYVHNNIFVPSNTLLHVQPILELYRK